MIAQGVFLHPCGVMAFAAVAGGMISPLNVPVWLEIVAMCTTGFFGAVLAANRGAPLLGILVGGLVVGLGGGVVRDILLNVMPAAIADGYLIPAVGAASLLGGFSGRFLAKSHLLLILLQAISLGLLVVIGSEKAMYYRVSPWAVVVLGIITAVAGGGMLDALSGVRSALLSQGRWHLSSLVIGAVGFLVLAHTTSLLVAEVGTVALIVILRLLSHHHGWSCPELPKPPPAS